MKNSKAFSVALPAESSEAERSEAAPTAVGADRPNPDVVAKVKRSLFTGAYKQRVLAEADKAKEESGGIGAQPYGGSTTAQPKAATCSSPRRV